MVMRCGFPCARSHLLLLSKSPTSPISALDYLGYPRRMSSSGGTLERRRGRAIFVAATKEHTGKTSVSMAVLGGLVQRFGASRVGYMKPVGQKYIVVEGENRDALKVDKDVAVAREHFGLKDRYEVMSPLVLEKGYTKRYCDGQIDPEEQKRKIREGFDELIKNNDFVVVEGTGHTGVGSIVGWSNADVARLLGVGVVLVSNGGLGKTFDELELNRILCAAKGAAVRGIILNKVKADKVDMVKEYMTKALKVNKWDTPILGVVPWAETLDSPAVLDLEMMFNTRSMSGREHILRRFTKFELVTTSLRRFLEKLEDTDRPKDHRRTCYITHATRSDIILGLLSHAGKYLDGPHFQAGLLLTGSPPGNVPHPFVEDFVRCATIPVLSAALSTTEVMKRLEGFTGKMTVDDKHRTNNVIDHYTPHIYLDRIMSTATIPPGGRDSSRETRDGLGGRPRSG